MEGYSNQPIPKEAAKRLLALDLQDKEILSYEKLDQWYTAWGGKCYVSFSGGKDSTVLAYLVIAHPPCTYLTVTGNRWFNTGRYGEKAVRRLQLREEASAFFMAFVNANVCKIAVENPVGYMSTHYRKPDCIIQPYEFGHHARKKTCLWLKGLPALRPTNIVDAGDILPGGYSVGASANYAKDEAGKIMRWNDPRTAKARSKTFPGIARAMAEQWGGDIRDCEGRQ